MNRSRSRSIPTEEREREREGKRADIHGTDRILKEGSRPYSPLNDGFESLSCCCVSLLSFCGRHFLLFIFVLHCKHANENRFTPLVRFSGPPEKEILTLTVSCCVWHRK